MESEVKTVFKPGSQPAGLSAADRMEIAEYLLRHAASRIRGVVFMEDCDLNALSDNLAEAATRLRDSVNWADASEVLALQARAARLSHLSKIAEDLDHVLILSRQVWPEDK